jgi:hypothetical protein
MSITNKKPYFHNGRSHGEYVIDLSGFSEVEPVFAYADDAHNGNRVGELRGLAVVGQMTVDGQHWWEGPRNCVLLKTTPEGARERRATFCTLSDGEFNVEVYYVRPDMTVELIHVDDFIRK